MRIDILTLFPQMFEPLRQSIIGRAVDNGFLSLNITDIRAYSSDKHLKCDDYPFGGGAGMVMMPQPIYNAVNAIDPNHSCLRIYMSPKGKRLTDALAKELACSEKDLLILCGHYEGVDQRVLDLCFDCEISIGDYVLTGGELAAMVTVDALSRFLPGVLGSEASNIDESITSGRLEYPQYTRPAEFMGVKVPEVLLSGHHGNVEKWRSEESLKLTQKLRPDLMRNEK